MDPNGNFYSQGDFEYQEHNGQTQWQSGPRSGGPQHYQYGGMGSQQYSSNPGSLHGDQGWDMSPNRNMSYQYAFNQNQNQMQMLRSQRAPGIEDPLASFHQKPMLRTQSAPGIEDPLEAISMNPKAVENVPLEDLTTNLHTPYRPPGYTVYVNGPAPHQHNAYSAQHGPMSEPIPELTPLIEVSSDEASDSAYATQPTDVASTYDTSSQIMGTQSQTGAENRSQAAQQHLASPTRPGVPRHSSDSRVSSTRVRRRATASQPICNYHDCKYQPKNPSDAIKHNNKHTKPYKCDFPECKAKGIGFATPNDLDRHRKCGKHNQPPIMGSGKAYVCAACTVSPECKIKWWPRLDNFKAHIVRRHKEHLLDIMLLIKRSERDVHSRPPDAITQFDDVSTLYQGGSIADRNDHYQFPDPQSASSRTMPMFHNQGETSLWTPEHESFGLYPIDELAGVGEAQHLIADGGPSRHEFNTSVKHGSNADGHAGLLSLSTAAEVSARHLEVPRIAVHPPRNSSPKRESDVLWETNSKVKRPRSIASATNADEVSDGEGQYECQEPGCGKIKKRKCDLRKHMKRHTRPYGCTLPRCYVRQGSRSDWKRHEDKAHSLPEAWKCTLKKSDGTPCFAYAYTLKKFRRHLSDEHKLSSKGLIEDHCDSMRLRKDGYNKFWCGFCRDIQTRDPADKRGHREWRWSHIGDHFDQDGDIDKWVCFEFNKPYEEITKAERKEQRRKYNEPASDSDEDGSKGLKGLKVADDALEDKTLDCLQGEFRYGQDAVDGDSFG